MSKTPAYAVANLIINDSDIYRIYEKGLFPILKKYGGELVTFDDSPQTLEGDTPPQGRIIILKFPSEEVAKKWYLDPEYDLLSNYRRNGTSLKFLTIIKGMPPRIKKNNI
tara:strand:- start:1598 stop:1927 length:330 start_codon:yes stop_codon:yes gene_type:complete